MRINIQKKGYKGNLRIDASQLEQFERKGWTKVPDEAIDEQTEEAVINAGADEEFEQS